MADPKRTGRTMTVAEDLANFRDSLIGAPRALGQAAAQYGANLAAQQNAILQQQGRRTAAESAIAAAQGGRAGPQTGYSYPAVPQVGGLDEVNRLALAQTLGADRTGPMTGASVRPSVPSALDMREQGGRATPQEFANFVGQNATTLAAAPTVEAPRQPSVPSALDMREQGGRATPQEFANFVGQNASALPVDPAQLRSQLARAVKADRAGPSMLDAPEVVKARAAGMQSKTLGEIIGGFFGGPGRVNARQQVATQDPAAAAIAATAPAATAPASTGPASEKTGRNDITPAKAQKITDDQVRKGKFMEGILLAAAQMPRAQFIDYLQAQPAPSKPLGQKDQLLADARADIELQYDLEAAQLGSVAAEENRRSRIKDLLGVVSVNPIAGEEQ